LHVFSAFPLKKLKWLDRSMNLDWIR